MDSEYKYHTTLDEIRQLKNAKEDFKRKSVLEIKTEHNAFAPINSSMKTIITTVNCIVSSGCLIFPVLFLKCGVLLSISIMLVMCGVNYITANYLLCHGREEEQDLPEILERVCGKTWSKIYAIGSGFLLCFVSIIYYILMVSIIFSVISSILLINNITDIGSPNEIVLNQFSYTYVCIISTFICAILVSIKDLLHIIKISSYGFIAIISYHFFLMYIFIQNIVNNGSISQIEQKTHQQYNWIAGDDLFQNASYAAGTFSLSFMIHQMVIPIYRKNIQQDDNSRDLAISYGITCFLKNDNILIIILLRLQTITYVSFQFWFLISFCISSSIVRYASNMCDGQYCSTTDHFDHIIYGFQFYFFCKIKVENFICYHQSIVQYFQHPANELILQNCVVKCAFLFFLIFLIRKKILLIKFINIFCVAGIIYSFSGIIGSLALFGLNPDAIGNTLFECTKKDDYLVILIQMIFAFYVTTLVPLPLFVGRQQIFQVFYDDIECIPTKIRLSFNLLWILLSFVIGVTHQNVGILMGFTGGVLGFILVSVIPVLFNYKCLYKGESYSLKKTSDTDPNIQFSVSSENGMSAPMLRKRSRISNICQHDYTYSKNQRIISGSIIVGFGFIMLIIQLSQLYSGLVSKK